MKINRIKINGMYNPVGFDCSRLTISYCVDGDVKTPLSVVIYSDKDCQNPVYSQEIDAAFSFCTPISFEAKKETQYFVKIEGINCQSETAYFEMGTEFDCSFIAAREKLENPVFYKRFRIDKELFSARLYVTGLGLYEAFVNGQKAGNEYLTPNYNDYDAYVQYQTYDITPFLQSENVIEIALGNGWYKGRFGLNHKEHIFGDNCVTAAKIVLTYMDGGKEVISTDTAWKARKSHVISGNIYDGEIQDMTVDTQEEYGVKVYKKKFNVIPRVSLPIVVKHRLQPELYISPKGEKILNFKQNFAGFVSFNVPLKKGQRVRLLAGEVLQDGCFYRDNLRTAKAEFVYVSDGKRRNVRPQFTFYGFRYMLVEGIDEVNPLDFTGNVLYSDLEETVKVKTDNDKMNRLLQNCVWGQRSNFVDVPTDCPQRDERLGWTGDSQVFSKTACFQMDCKVFYDKYLKDVAIDQDTYGSVTTYSPAMKEGEVAASVWGDAATIIPWNVYRFYGDKGLLEKHFPSMEKYVLYLFKKDEENGGARLYNFGFHLGDWLSQDGVSPSALRGATDEYFIASLYYYRSVRIVADSAKILGFYEKYTIYDNLAKEIKRAILKEYFTSNGKLSVDTQTAYTLAVLFEVYKDRDRLVQDFARRVRRDGFKVKGGFVGATQFVQALMEAGLDEYAFRVLYSEKYPSWLACVNLGATTIWERWNSLEENGKVSGSGMNSLNHYSFGAVAEAIYSYVAGIKSISAGFKQVVIEPKFNYRLKAFDFDYLSASGEYGVHYRIDGEKIYLTLKIPFGVTATLKLKGERSKRLKGGKYHFVVSASEDLVRPFSVDTAICELIDNEKTREVLKKNIPMLYYFLSSNDAGLNGESLRYVTSLRSFFVDPEKVTSIDEQLKLVTI